VRRGTEDVAPGIGAGPSAADPEALRASARPSSDRAAALDRSSRGRFARAVAGIEERFVIPCYSSPRGGAWVAAYGALALPLLARGRERFGTVLFEGEPVRVTTIGRPGRIRGLLDHWFDPPFPRLENGAIRCLWRPTDCKRRPAELRVAEIHVWAAPRFRRAGWRIVPNSIRWVAGLDSVPPRAPGRSLRSDLAKVRDGRFTIEETHDRADWEDFFSTMARPAAIRRFGGEAWIPSRRMTRAFARAGTLLMLRAGGVRVAGICVVRTGASLWAPVMGVIDPAAARRDGVGAALYKLTFDWARARGIRTVDLGRTSPHVDDPIAWYKRKWGFRPAPDPLAHRFAVWTDPHAPVLHRAVARSPVLMEEPDGLAPFAGAG
jgi:hypothetical protein